MGLVTLISLNPSISKSSNSSPDNNVRQKPSYSALADDAFASSNESKVDTKLALSEIFFNITSEAIRASNDVFIFDVALVELSVWGFRTLNIAAVESPMIVTIAKTITMAKPSALLPRKAAGITLAETLIYLSILGVVTAGIWQTFTFINSSINTNIERTAELEASETYFNYISTLSGRAVSSDISGDGSCISFVTESPNGDEVNTTFKVIDPENYSQGALKSTGWVTTLIGASCDDTPSRPDWRPLTDDGDISLVAASTNALDLSRIFADDTAMGGSLNYTWDSMINEIIYDGGEKVLGTDSFETPSGTSSFSIDFWVQDPFADDFTSGPGLLASALPDNSTFLAFGSPLDASRQVVLGLEDRKLVLRRGQGNRRHISNQTFDNLSGIPMVPDDAFWSHIAVTWNGGDNSSAFYHNGKLVTDITVHDGAPPNGDLSFDLPAISQLFLGGYDPFDGTSKVRLQSKIDELRIWNTSLDPQRIRNMYRRQSLESEPNLIGYWRFESEATDPDLVDSSLRIADWSQSNNPLYYMKPVDPITFDNETFPAYLSAMRAPVTVLPFKKAGSNDTLSLEMQFVVTNAFGAQQRQPTLSKRVPVARFAPVGLVALEDDSSVEFEVEIIGSHDDITLYFDAIFDPSVKPQANACDLYLTDTPGGCNFTASALRIPLQDSCLVADNESLARCVISSRDITLQDGVAFSSLELRDFGADSGEYQTVPGDKITMQVYETCTFGAADDGATAMLIDTGYMQGDDFINRYSYVTYSFEAEPGENVEYLFGTAKGGSQPQFFTKDGTARRDVVKGSPDFGAFTKRRHISPFLFRTTDDNYNFVMGFDAPYVQWSNGDNLWNDNFTDRYDFTVASTDSNEPCSQIGISEVDMCNLVEDPDPVKVCNNPSNDKYCFVEFQISNMPTDPDAFIKLDEKDEFQKPTSTLEDFVGVNRWGNGYTDGFVVDLGVMDLQSYDGDPLMQVKLRAGMDFWYLQTTPNSASGGKSVKLRTGETDTVRYRLSTSKVCPTP